MNRYPSPHTHFMPVLPLTKELYQGLLALYQRAVTHVTKFYVPGFENSEIIWPETADDHQWIIDNILSYYGVSADECVNLLYNRANVLQDSSQREDVDRGDWGFNNVPPWAPNTLNFTRCRAGSIIGRHNDHEAGCKINIPILNMSAANVYFHDSDERYHYAAPALLNIRAYHEVENMERLERFNIPERTFFQVVFKGDYEHYRARLPLPYGY